MKRKLFKALVIGLALLCISPSCFAQWKPTLTEDDGGTVQAKAVDSRMAATMQIWAAMGHPCGHDFIAATFLKEHPEYGWMTGLLRDMKSHPWTVFTSGMRK